MTRVPGAADQRLLGVLASAQRYGFLGPGDISTHVQHARAHNAAAQPQPGQLWCDLGSGGGVPGLVMALAQPEATFVLLDRSERRADFLETATRELQLTDQVFVALGDAAELAHLPQHRHTYDGVVSRAFGPPSAVAECSAGLLRLSGQLVVSEPPDSHEPASKKHGDYKPRWPAKALRQLGMCVLSISDCTPTFIVIKRVETATVAYPRTWKQIRKQPLF